MNVIWAIARNTILMTVRRRAPLVIVLFLAIGLPFLSHYAEGDNTIVGLLKLVVTFDFTAISALLMLMILYLSSTVLHTELRGKQIYLIDAKPVARWQILAGKWVGVSLLCAWFLILMGAATYIVIMFLARPVKNRPEQLSNAYRQFLVCRREFKPERPDIESEIRKLRKNLIARGQLDESRWDPKELRRELEFIITKRLIRIPYRSAFTFDFKDLPQPGENSPMMTVRYNLRGVRGDSSAGWLHHQWVLGNSSSSIAFREMAMSKSGTTREFQTNSIAIGSQGDLNVSIYNMTGPEGDKPPARINVPLDNGLAILVPVGSFEMNFVRGLFLLWIRLAMLAAIGIAANTFLNGAISAFLVFGLIITGVLNTFVFHAVAPKQKPDKPAATRTDIDVGTPEKIKESVSAGIESAHTGGKYGLAFLLQILPNFDDTNPVPDLVLGREISYGRLLWRLFMDLGVRAGLFFALGIYSFRRRELGLPVM